LTRQTGLLVGVLGRWGSNLAGCAAINEFSLIVEQIGLIIFMSIAFVVFNLKFFVLLGRGRSAGF